VQIAQILGALMILAAFGLAQRRTLSVDGYVYLLLNLAGSAVLVITALDASQWGFVMLNTCWAAVSVWGLTTKLRGPSRIA
jgi:uncharacterized membrane protein